MVPLPLPRLFPFILLLAFTLFHASFAQAQCISGDCRNGKGTYVYPSGAKYVGEFKNGEINGIGVCYYTNGTKYSGEWRARYPDGKGTKTYADGNKRTGSWKKGKPVDEQGKILEEYIVKNKEEQQDDGTNIQSGCLSGDCKTGPGVFAYPDGSKYEGNFTNGKFDGAGTFYFSNGDKYVGHFHENYPDGQGTLFPKNSALSPETGEWKQGEFLGRSLVENGKIGCIQGDCENGKGTYVFKEGAAKYVGGFEDGQPEGFGICTYANGDRYRGEWSEGAFGGKGVLTLRDGTQISGYWRNGEYIGKDQPEGYEPVADAPNDEPAIKTEEKPVEKPVVEKPVETLAKVWAVVVGVASYDHMPVLRYTDDDAYRFYAFLKGFEGGSLPDDQVHVLIDEDATRENILTNLSEVFSMAGPNDLVLFYFSGHGLNGSFLPIDFDGFNNKLTHEEIAAVFNKCKAKYRLLLADACHSGSIFAMRSGDPDPALVQFYKNLSKSVSGTALIMSSKADETSLESAGLRQGVFSHFLIRGLKGEADKDKNKTVTVEELYEFVAQNVRDYTGNRQSPVIKGTYDPVMPVSAVR